MKLSVSLALGFTMAASGLVAQTPTAMEIAVEREACGEDRGILSAEFIEEGRRIRVICGAPVAFDPLSGGLGPALGLAGIAGVAGMAGGGGGGTSSTSSTIINN